MTNPEYNILEDAIQTYYYVQFDISDGVDVHADELLVAVRELESATKDFFTVANFAHRSHYDLMEQAQRILADYDKVVTV